MADQNPDSQKGDPNRTRGERAKGTASADAAQDPGGGGGAVYGDGIDGAGDNSAGGSYGDKGGFGGYGTPSSVPSTVQPGASGDDGADDRPFPSSPPMPSSSGKT